MDKIAVNYLILTPTGASATDLPGFWTLAAKRSDTAYTDKAIEVVKPEGRKFDATRDTLISLFNKGDKVEMPVLAFGGTNPKKTPYLFRQAAFRDTDGTYIAASKWKKASILTQLPTPKIDSKNGTFKLKKNMLTEDGDGVVTYHQNGAKDLSADNIVKIWIAATEKRPQSVSKVFTPIAPPSGE